MEYPYNKKFMNDDDFISLLNESCSVCGGEGSEDGLEVLMGNLAKIHEYSGELLSMLSQDAEIEDWVKDKISKASESMGDVKHYMEYKSSAYAVQSHAMGAHGGDVYMGQKASVSGMPQQQGRMPGERLAVMGQLPTMTPPSSMAGGSSVPSAALAAAPAAPMSSDMDDDMSMEEPGGEEDFEMPGLTSVMGMEDDEEMVDDPGSDMEEPEMEEQEDSETMDEPMDDEEDDTSSNLSELWKMRA